MKMKKIGLSIIGLALFATTSMWAESITITWNGITKTVNNVPTDLVGIINSNMDKIEEALTTYQVTEQDFDDYGVDTKIQSFYSNLSSYGIKTTTPYTTAINGFNDFSDVLTDVLPNTQTQQNVWSQAWIGGLPHFGFGLNAGASELDVTALKDVASALGIDVGDLRDSYVMPTVTADIRIGGFILPFDIGFNICSLDSSKIGALETAIDPVAFDFFTVGGDIRYAVIRGGGIFPRLSVGGGFSYTDGGVSVSDNGSKAALDFTSTTVFLSTQASVKLLCLVPFVGGRVMFNKTNVDWSAKADWVQLSGNSDFADAQKWGLLPTNFSGGSESGYFEDIRPQLYGGLSLDMLILDLTASASYDFLAKIPSGAVSVRLSL